MGEATRRSDEQQIPSSRLGDAICAQTNSKGSHQQTLRPDTQKLCSLQARIWIVARSNSNSNATTKCCCDATTTRDREMAELAAGPELVSLSLSVCLSSFLPGRFTGASFFCLFSPSRLRGKRSPLAQAGPKRRSVSAADAFQARSRACTCHSARQAHFSLARACAIWCAPQAANSRPAVGPKLDLHLGSNAVQWQSHLPVDQRLPTELNAAQPKPVAPVSRSQASLCASAKSARHAATATHRRAIQAPSARSRCWLVL